jgi:hypothetical protein
MSKRRSESARKHRVGGRTVPLIVRHGNEKRSFSVFTDPCVILRRTILDEVPVVADISAHGKVIAVVKEMWTSRVLQLSCLNADTLQQA